MHNQPKYHPGFTLVELLVTIAIASIVLGLAVPSFSNSIGDNQLTTHTNELVTALSVARSETVKRGIQVTVRRKGETSMQWENGWNVFVDNDGNGIFDDDNDATLCEAGEDCLLRTYDALPNGYTLTSSASPYQDYIAYLPDGFRKVDPGEASVEGAFTLCRESGSAMLQRIITINATGRPNVNVTTGICP